MSSDSKASMSSYFDKIRIKPRGPKQQATISEQKAPACEWLGCAHPGSHRAPKGRGNERDDAIARYQKDALTGHRPTWKMGANSGGKGKTKAEDAFGEANDPFNVFSELNGRADWRPGPETKAQVEQRKVMNAERKALQVMGLDSSATVVEVKTRFKMLVKQHHPDANGGDRATEELLIEIIKAYYYLKTTMKE